MTIAFDNNVNVSLSTNMGWTDVSDWVKTIPVHIFPGLTSLVFHGYAKNLPILIREIRNAQRRYPPHKRSVNSTISGLISTLEDNQRSASIAIVSNGIIPRNFAMNRR